MISTKILLLMVMGFAGCKNGGKARNCRVLARYIVILYVWTLPLYITKFLKKIWWESIWEVILKQNLRYKIYVIIVKGQKVRNYPTITSKDLIPCGTPSQTPPPPPHPTPIMPTDTSCLCKWCTCRLLLGIWLPCARFVRNTFFC